MKRREFITLLGGAAAAWPLAAWAQQSNRMRRIGVLMAHAAGDPEGQKRAAAFQQGLEELRRSSPRNVETEFRWTAGDAVRAQAQAKELVELGVDIILANSTPSLLAARQATNTIPIVFVAIADPVAQGFVKSLQALRSSARFDLIESPVSNESDVERAIIAAGSRPAAGLIVLPDSFLNSHRDLVVALIARQRLPAIYALSEFTRSGGLIATESSEPICFDARHPTLIAFSRARSRPTCRFSSRPSSSWSSILRPPGRLASMWHRRCSPSPTR
jgi:putative ABC transport system substrate-binding protein